jgi:hypothetical protein
LALNNAVRATGEIGVVGVFVPQGPKSDDPLRRDGRIAFDLGVFFQKGPEDGQQSMQCQGLQPPPARPDRRGQSRALIRRLAQPVAGRGA